METCATVQTQSALRATRTWFVALSCGLLAMVAAAGPAAADEAPGIIETVVGGDNGDGRTAMDTVVDPRGLATCYRVTGFAPDLFIADGKGNRVRRVDGVTGVVTTVAGTGAAGFAGDGGPATDAQLTFPLDVACDAAGNVYVADGGNNRRVRMIDLSGRISTVAGNGVHDYSGDNVLATQAALTAYALALDAAGNIYIADADNRRVRKVGSNGIITTVAGTGVNGYARDGRAAAQENLSFPSGVAVDTAGRLYIVDYGNKVVYRVVNGIISVVAGDYLPAFGGDGGPATSAHLYLPNRATVDSLGNLTILDAGNSRVRRVDTAGIITTIAGNGSIGSTGDGGAGTNASLFPLHAVASDQLGNVYIGSSVDTPEPWSYDNRVRLVDSAGKIVTMVGIADNGDGPSPRNAVINPQGLATDQQARADLYIADAGNNQIRKVNGVTGEVTTMAGTGAAGFSGDGGAATAARLSGPTDVVIDASGTVYIADQNNHRVRRVDTRGIIATVAGNGTFGYGGDARLGYNSSLASPSGVAVDAAGNLYIADRYNYRIRKVSLSGIITTVAGNGTYSPSNPPGDGGPATQAQLGVPTDVVVTGNGSLYIAEFGTHRVRLVRPDGVISTVAGNGNYGAGGDGGPAVNAQLNGPYRLALDPSGNLYVADSGNLRVRRIDPVSGIITTVAGTGVAGTAGDGGLATAANLFIPTGLTVDPSGHLYIAQSDSSRVRRVLLDTGTVQPSPTRTSTPLPSTVPTRTPTPTQVRTATPTASVTATQTFKSTAVPTSTPRNTATTVSTTAPTMTPSAGGSPTQVPTQTVVPTVLVTVSGTIRYQGTRLEVNGATVQLQAAPGAAAVPMEAETDITGHFVMQDVSGDTRQIQPRKLGDVEGTITTVDAVYALQAARGMRGLRSGAELACDVNGDGQVSPADALLVLQATVGLVSRFPAAVTCQSDWIFMPEPAPVAYQEVIQPRVSPGSCEPGAIAYRPLTVDARNQDFIAMAFGDCSGDWRPAESASGATLGRATASSQPLLRHIQYGRKRVRASLYVPRPGTFYAFNVQLAYDHNALHSPRVTQLGDAQAALMAVNDQQPGVLALSLAGAQPMRGGRVLSIDFDVTGPRPPKGSVSIVDTSLVRFP